MMCMVITDLQRSSMKPDCMNWKMLWLSMIFDVQTYPRLPDHSESHANTSKASMRNKTVNQSLCIVPCITVHKFYQLRV